MNYGRGPAIHTKQLKFGVQLMAVLYNIDEMKIYCFTGSLPNENNLTEIIP